MKLSTFTLILGTAATSFLLSCSNPKTSTDSALKKMLVEKYYDSPDFDNVSSKVKIINIFKPEFTDSSMLEIPQLLAIKDGKAYVHNQGGKWMNTFSYPDGKLLDAFNHYGQGPEEYIHNYFAVFTPADGIWTVEDLNVGRYNLMQYDIEGNFVRKTVNDSVQTVSPMKNGNWLAFNDFFSLKDGFRVVTERKLYEYDRNWELINILTLRDARWELQGTMLMDKINFLEGHNYITDNDTIWEYLPDSHSLSPVIAVELGKYSFKWGSVKDYEELEAAHKIYPSPKLPVFNDRYAFDYYYREGDPRTVRFDLYDLKTGDLVYRRTVLITEENEMRLITEGFPVEVDGHTVYGNFLEYVRDNHFFVMVPMDELVDVYDTDEINPIIVEIEIAD